MKSFAMILVLFSLVSCGKNGQDGHNGLNGIDGINGVDGRDGKDASLTIIKFCPNLEDDVGNKYLEKGLCIDNKVYAVYSSNGLSALTEIPVGLYVTTSPAGKNCTFEVKSNCIVEQK